MGLESYPQDILAFLIVVLGPAASLAILARTFRRGDADPVLIRFAFFHAFLGCLVLSILVPLFREVAGREAHRVPWVLGGTLFVAVLAYLKGECELAKEKDVEELELDASVSPLEVESRAGLRALYWPLLFLGAYVVGTVLVPYPDPELEVRRVERATLLTLWEYRTDVEVAVPGGHFAAPAARVLRLPFHHPETTRVTRAKARAPADHGTWVLIEDASTKTGGSLYIDCTHEDSRGHVWADY